MLEYINSPDDIKNLSYKELDSLSDEIRNVIISTVSCGGGHLASNLGIVETTLALHRSFSAPKDKIIFDVSHQSYAHKLITGRYTRFDTLRKFGGISGFTDRNESVYDTVTAGHSGSSVSIALGIAEANKAAGSDAYAVAVVGDGSFTNGMIYEAINTMADCSDLNVIIVLNDNEMSISKNVGGMTEYLSRIRTSRGYLNLKHSLEKFLLNIPFVGKSLASFLKWWKDVFKSIFIKDTLFENLGIPYIGPVDGHDIEKIEAVFNEAKRHGGISIVHVITKKGKGYEKAEITPENYHSIGIFDPDEGAVSSKKSSFTSVFGDIMCERAKKDRSLFAVTGAMRDGVGLGRFSELYPNRYRDVGIAEEHAVAFSGGLAISGMTPVCALYSTFAQRTFDQVFHDAALQKAHVILALDHCGLVSADGCTHQGIYDVALFSMLPGVVIRSPENYSEMKTAFDSAFNGKGIEIVRYPKGGEFEYDRSIFTGDEIKYTVPDKTPDVAVITYGTITSEAVRAAELLSSKYTVRVIKLLQIHPIDLSSVSDLCSGARATVVLEEGIRSGGIGEKIASVMSGTHIFAIENEFIPHGDRASLLKKLGLDAETVAEKIKNILA